VTTVDPLSRPFLLTRGPIGQRCRIGQLIADAEPDEGTRLAGFVADPGVSATRLAIALNFYGYAVGETTIRKHRRGECLCRLMKH
jgi:hypothetical protein